MKIISWNINALKKHQEAFQKVIEELQPDIFCLQEIRIREDQIDCRVEGYRCIMNPAHLSQFYGTGLYIRNDVRPKSITFDFDLKDSDYEGRIEAVELQDLVVINSYWPYSAQEKDGKWLKHRLAWTEEMIAFVKDIASKKPVVICGDMNIVRHDADSYDHISVQRKGCFYPEEHEGFERLILEANLIDAYRTIHPEGRKQTTWPNAKDNRYRMLHQGYRIDYFLVSSSLADKIIDSDILEDVEGSTNCPITLELKE